ncbi:hypothetical protein GCM10011519_25700 [Marmoricola endophyticus]|uniref:Uncharacterized protein n=1 Tax=Marmoricola endophyticus TaxID=2040280 RepID=A0A917F5N6_9ACTN|nr:hypothetical protein [Marmoricola endophyticus]GGF50595.1 hypothetical protein GCM10011519_25700 [Marmoricola endophyticus]
MTSSPEHHQPSTKETRQRGEREFGGMKPFCAFFGWLTASGMLVLLTALLAAAGLALDLTDTLDAGSRDAETIGWGGVVVVLVVVFVAYYCGGYVAGRMARFDGLRQGVAVFGWAVLAAIVVAVLSAIGGAKFDVLQKIDSFPRLPTDLGETTALAAVLLVGVVVVSLVAAMLGGLAGMHFHRTVDTSVVGR